MISFIESLSWREPLWLLLALQPVFVYLLTLLARKLQDDHFANPHLLPWVRLDSNRVGNFGLFNKLLLFSAWACFAIAMSGPRIASKTVSTDESSYTNIIVLFDVSRSMSAHDVYPSRLARARLELLDLVERSKRSRIAIVLYAAKAQVLSPLTSDKNLLRHYISNIKPSILPVSGSGLKQALQFTSELLGRKNHQAILLISDGESTATSINEFEGILSAIKKNNISIFSLITGTETGSPLPDQESGWLTFENQDVITKANASLLKQIALRTNGRYSEIDETDADWQELYDRGIARINPISERIQHDSELVIWTEYYSWFLLAGVFCFVLAYTNISFTIKPANAVSATLLAVLISGLMNSDVIADEQYLQAYRSYQQKDYQQAEQQFSKVDSYAGRIGQASAAYRNKNYPEALMLFIQASLSATTDPQRVHALFNLANCYYQVKNYHHAASIYQDVLRYQPDHFQAKNNLAYAQTLAKKQKTVEDDTATSRGGRGPRTARLAGNAETGKGNLTLGDDSETEPYGFNTGNDIPAQASDLRSAGIVSQDIETGEDTSWTYQVKDINEIGAITTSITTDEHVFWQRVFEWEDGFPSPLVEPVTVPGMTPW